MSARAMAIDLYNQAVPLLNKAKEVGTEDSATTYRLLASAVAIDPNFKEGWYEVGNVNGDLGFAEGAVACWRRALEVDPKDAKALTNLGHRLYQLGRHEEALAATARAIELEPDAPFGWCNLSLIESVQENTTASLEHALKAFQLDKDHGPHIEMGLAFAYLYARDWAKGLKHMEARFAYRLKHFLNFPWPKWDGEPLEGKTLFITSEQGMGDALSFLRFVPMVAARGGQIYLQVHPELVKMAAQMLRSVDNVLIGPLTAALPPADYWTSMNCLPVNLRLSNAEIEQTPTLAVPYSAIAATAPWKVPGRRLHVGICWAGAPENDINHWRSLKVTDFLELYQVPGIQLYSLQVGPAAQDIYTSGCQPLIKDLAPFIRDVTDTVALVRELDLIITVETSIGHIAGAIDADCWVLYARNGGDWRIGRTRRGSLWYPRHRIFKQGSDAAWPPVLDQVVAALKERVSI